MSDKGKKQTKVPKEGLPVLLEYITQSNWAMRLETLQHLTDIIERHITGGKLSAAEVAEITEVRDSSGKDETRNYDVTADGAAVIPVSGVIAKYASMVNGVSSPRGTSIEKLTGQLAEARADRLVSSILLYIESPGGSIAGLGDFARQVYETSFEIPVVAFIDDLGASAAYWIASQANYIYANQTAEVGSIGAYTVYLDSSERAKQEGLKFHIFRSGPNKGTGQPGVKITAENQATIQTIVDDYYEIFINAVLRGRAGAIDKEALREAADGRTFIAADAVELGLVDAISTIENVMAASLPDVRQQMISQSQAIKETAMTNAMTKEEKQAQDAAAERQKKEIAAAERERITLINDALADEGLAKVREKAIAGGLGLEVAKALAFDKLVETSDGRIEAIKGELAEATTKLEAIAAGGVETTAAKPTDADDESKTDGTDDGKAESYAARVHELISRGGETKAAAYSKAAKEMPKAHKAWKETQVKD